MPRALGYPRRNAAAIVGFVALNPDAGDEIKGTGGARKIRFGGKGKGKSGSFRVISFYGGADIPVFLLTVFAKNEKTNLTKAERNEFKATLTALAAAYRGKNDHGQQANSRATPDRQRQTSPRFRGGRRQRLCRAYPRRDRRGADSRKSEHEPASIRRPLRRQRSHDSGMGARASHSIGAGPRLADCDRPRAPMQCGVP